MFSFLALFIITTAQASTLVLGGSPVTPNELIAKRTVGLIFVDKHKQTSICTGSILDQNHILTARHCTENIKTGFVIFSLGNIFQVLSQARNRGNGRDVFEITDYQRFTGYPGPKKLFSQDNFTDLAVLEFEGQMPEGYEPAHFLPREKLMSLLREKTLSSSRELPRGEELKIILAGYGIVTYRDDPNQGVGEGYLRKTNTGLERLSSTGSNLYYGGNRRGNVCMGDSGGPSMIENQGDLYVIGVTSWSDCITHSVATLISSESLPLSPQGD